MISHQYKGAPRGPRSATAAVEDIIALGPCFAKQSNWAWDSEKAKQNNLANRRITKVKTGPLAAFIHIK